MLITFRLLVLMLAFLCCMHSIPILYCYAYLRLSSSYAYYIWAKSPSVMAIPLVTSNIASRVIKVVSGHVYTFKFEATFTFEKIQSKIQSTFFSLGIPGFTVPMKLYTRGSQRKRFKISPGASCKVSVSIVRTGC